MRRFLTLVFLLFLALPAGITITGCYRNPGAKYCNGLGYGAKITDVYTITLQPENTGISMAFGQTRQITAPVAQTCKQTSVSAGTFSYGTTNNQLVDVSPSGNMCAGTWNRNSGGGIADYTICSYPSPLPSSGGLPYSTAYITASADAVTSNPVEVYVHAPITSISLVGPTQCLSQTQTAVLDAQACYESNGVQALMCAPASVTTSATPTLACPLPVVNGVTVPLSSIPSCTNAIGVASYSVGTPTVAQINPETNEITAELPGTTAVTASVALSGSSAGYFSTCPPASITVSLNGSTSGTVTQGVTQNLVTNVIDTMGNPITGLTLDYQSTNPLDITASSTGSITASYPGAASVYAICQPTTCDPAPINEVGVYGTGLSISSNPVNIAVPGKASSYVWYGAPNVSQYFVPVDLLSGTIGSNVRLPYVPNSMVMDHTGTNIYFGSTHELMIFTTTGDSLSAAYPGVPGVVLAVAPNNGSVLVNDQVRQLFYLVNSSGTISATFGGMGTSAEWSPDSKTLYVTDSAKTGTGHTNTLYVYNVNTGWTTYPLTTSGGSTGPQDVAITIPGVGAYVSGDPTVAHTWCPSGNPVNYATMSFYPQGDSVNADTDVLTATTDGMHILGAAAVGGAISFSDIGVAIPTGTTGACPAAIGGILQPLAITHNLNQTTLAVSATAVTAVVSSPASVSQGTTLPTNSLSFITYDGSTPGATLPYYLQKTSPTSTLGTVGYVTLMNGASPDTVETAPIAGGFSPDSTLFFVSTAGDNMIHYINTATLTDTQQISPNLPACTPVSAGGTDLGCTYAGSGTVVPATVIQSRPRATD